MQSQIKNKNLEIFLENKKIQNSMLANYISLTLSSLVVYPLKRMVAI